jgi:hypothetical protein
MFKPAKWWIAAFVIAATACEAPTAPQGVDTMVAPSGAAFDAESDSAAAVNGGAIGSGNRNGGAIGSGN